VKNVATAGSLVPALPVICAPATMKAAVTVILLIAFPFFVRPVGQVLLV